MAREFGAIPVDNLEVNPINFIREATNRQGADAVLEVVGSESAGRLAFDLVRPRGIISTVGS